MRKRGLFTTRRVSEGPATKSLTYASGYEKQPSFKLFFAISIAALPYNLIQFVFLVPLTLFLDYDWEQN